MGLRHSVLRQGAKRGKFVKWSRGQDMENKSSATYLPAFLHTTRGVVKDNIQELSAPQQHTASGRLAHRQDQKTTGQSSYLLQGSLKSEWRTGPTSTPGIQPAAQALLLSASAALPQAGSTKLSFRVNVLQRPTSAHAAVSMLPALMKTNTI